MRLAMKCAIVLACLMTITHQAVYQPQSQWLQFPHPYFLGMPSNVQMQRAAYLKGFYDAGRLGISPSWQQQSRDMDRLIGQVEHHQGDSQARFRSPFDQSSNVANETGVEELGRLFFAGSGATANYLWKTIFTFSTSTITLCYMSSCIPASQFAAGATNSICRRRRAAFYPGAAGDDDAVVDIEPTNVETVEPTPFAVLEDPNFQPIPQGRELTINKVPVLDSSFDELLDSALLQHPTHPSREKRFLYLLTTTMVSFKVFASTYTTTISPGAAANKLTCRPSGIGVC